MPNPADDVVEVNKSSYVSQNRESVKSILDMIKNINQRTQYNAIIKSIDGVEDGVFTIDVYKTHYGVAPEIVDIEAIILEPGIFYVVNSPCRVVFLDDGTPGIVKPKEHFYFKITADTYDDTKYSNFIRGVPSNRYGETILTQALWLDIQYPYPDNQLLSIYEKVPDPSDVVGVHLYHSPLDYNAGHDIAATSTIGLIITSKGSQLPIGQYIEMVYKNTAQNMTGFDYVKSHHLVVP